MTLLGERKASLTDVAYEEIRNSILMGTLSPGQKVVVNDLVAEWNISNTPIKEALNRLVTEGLVEFEPRRGMRVRRQLTALEIREKFEFRTVLEVHCCHQAARVIDRHPKVLEEMTENLHAIRKMTDEQTFNGLYQSDGLFHRLIVSLCNNSEMKRCFDQLICSIHSFGVLAIKYSPAARQAASYEEHKSIYEALRKGDGHEMAAAMRMHLRNSVEHIAAFYEENADRIADRQPKKKLPVPARSTMDFA